MEEIQTIISCGAGGVNNIVAADGEPVSGSGDLLRIRCRFTVGDEMPIRVWRNGAYIDLVLKLEQAAE